MQTEHINEVYKLRTVPFQHPQHGLVVRLYHTHTPDRRGPAPLMTAAAIGYFEKSHECLALPVTLVVPVTLEPVGSSHGSRLRGTGPALQMKLLRAVLSCAAAPKDLAWLLKNWKKSQPKTEFAVFATTLSTTRRLQLALEQYSHNKTRTLDGKPSRPIVNVYG